jgi:hypothetical protein
LPDARTGYVYFMISFAPSSGFVTCVCCKSYITSIVPSRVVLCFFTIALMLVLQPALSASSLVIMDATFSCVVEKKK